MGQFGSEPAVAATGGGEPSELRVEQDDAAEGEQERRRGRPEEQGPAVEAAERPGQRGRRREESGEHERDHEGRQHELDGGREGRGQVCRDGSVGAEGRPEVAVERVADEAQELDGQRVVEPETEAFGGDGLPDAFAPSAARAGSPGETCCRTKTTTLSTSSTTTRDPSRRRRNLTTSLTSW